MSTAAGRRGSGWPHRNRRPRRRGSRQGATTPRRTPASRRRSPSSVGAPGGEPSGEAAAGSCAGTIAVGWAAMSRQRTSVASLVAIVALAMGFVVAAFSLPIDDFWLSIASGRAIAAGADPTRAVEFSWMTVLPGALNPQWGAQLLLGAHGSLMLALVVNALLISAALALTWIRTASRRHGVSSSVVAMLLVIAALS